MIIFHQDTFQDDAIRLDISSPAFRSGVGFFETLLYNGRCVCHLQLHCKRLFASLDQARMPYATVDFSEIIHELLRLNHLAGREARINIFYPLIAENEPVSPIVAVAPYARTEKTPLRLCLCAEPVQFPLHAHKSMSTMYTYLERRNALEKGFDDALLRDPHDHVLETTIASLLVADAGGRLIAPQSKHLLPGTSLALAMEHMDIEQRPVKVPELAKMKHAYVLNSLAGAIPVLSIEQDRYECDWKTSRRITDIVCTDSGID